jgi:hypothetical protein
VQAALERLALAILVRAVVDFILERSTAADGTADLVPAFMPEGSDPGGTAVAVGAVVVGADRLRPA